MSGLAGSLEEAIGVFRTLEGLAGSLEEAAAMAVATLRAGRKILVCGNGGSACEAQHLAGELVGRYKQDRRALAAIALNADGATMSCIGNDYRFEEVFSRQVEALGQAGDLLIVFTTSGESANVLEALRAARRLGVQSIAFLGRDGGAARPLADVAVVVPYSQTNRVQEAHQFLLHCLMDEIEAGLLGRDG
jgi:phosphoheptose isomerase